MKGLLLCVALAVACVSAKDVGLRVKFNVGLNPGTDFFFEVPRTISRAILEGWSVTQRAESPFYEPLVLYCPQNDFTLCAFFDDFGDVAGLQIALAQDQFTDSIYDWTIQGFIEWVPASPGGVIRKYYAIQQYFVSDAYLQKSAEERQALRNDKKILQEDAIFLTGFNRNIDRVPAKTSEIEQTSFTKQACIPWMGRHYYYNMSPNTLCQADTMYPWFPLVQDGELIGTGFIVFGKLPIVDGERDWFERPPSLAVRVIVPSGPQCLYDLAGSTGLVTMHIYYIDQPWWIGCLFQ